MNKKKTWLSHSGIDVLYRCPRCFWLRYNKKIYQPQGITSRLPDRFDRLIKAYFDGFRDGDSLPPIVEGEIEGKLENPFQEKYFYSINNDYGFWGKLDECVIHQEKYVPVDFKTSSSDPRGKDVFPAYQNQLDEYAFLLEKNNKPTLGIGHLIFFYPQDSNDLHNGFPMIVHTETLMTDPGSVEKRIFEAIDVLEGEMPPPAKDCPFCKWYEDILETLK